MAVSEVESAWGAAPKKDGKNYSWPDKFVKCTVDGEVLAITITTGDYITVKGLKAGSSKAEVLKIYGKAPDTTGGNLIYPKWGIAFYLAGESVSTIQESLPSNRRALKKP